jgi:hypothetical protein
VDRVILSYYEILRRFRFCGNFEQVLGEVNSIDAQQEAAALFRASLSLFERWGVPDEQAAILLDVPLRTYRRWKGRGWASVLPNVMPDCRT